MFKWSQDNKVELSFIAPGKPQQNAFVESFNGKFRKECLNLNCFGNLFEARDVIMNWRLDYNTNRLPQFPKLHDSNEIPRKL
jgi:putative transposase